ncbi:MAG: hypothetical protein PHD66_00700 [Eubacteriales bacterium]|nr:hypothetical protein [Eubacteriales bacterium]
MNFKKKFSAFLLLIMLIMLIFSTLTISVAAELETFEVKLMHPTGATVSFNPEPDFSVPSDSYTTYTFKTGSVVTMSVSAATGYKVDSVKIGTVTLPYQSSYQLYSATEITINTSQVQMAAITVNSGSFTTVFEGADGGSAEIGSSVTLRITPNEGYTVTKILYNDVEVGAGNEYTFTVGETNNFEIITEGASIVYASLEVVVSEGGNVSVSPEGSTYPAGTSLELTFAASASYTLASVTINGVEIAPGQISGNKYSFIINSDTVVTVVYKKSYTITTTVGVGGKISINGETVSGSSTVKVAEGTDVVLVVTPNLGYKVASVRIDNITVALNEESSYTIPSVSSGAKIQVSFEATTETQYNIVATAGPGGTISPSGNTNPVESGKSKSFEIYPNSGYEIDTVTVDGNAVAISNNKYTFSGVISNHTIHATFKAVSPTSDFIEPEDIDWATTGTITIDISKQTKVSAEVFQKIKTDYSDRKVVFESGSYKWIIPESGEITCSSAAGDFAITVNGGSNYNNIASLINMKVESLNYKVVTYGRSIIFPKGTELVFYMGGDYSNKPVQHLIYNGAENKLVNPINSSGVSEVSVQTATSDGWVTVIYNNDSDIIFSEELQGYYKIAASASAGGTINPAGNQTIETGGEIVFEIKANEGYVISSLKVDGVEVSDALGQTSYTYSAFKNVSQDHTISAEFLMQEDYEQSLENGGKNSALIVSLIIVFLALACAATLFIVKWRQEKY